jgi:hypothetical protein
MKHLLIQLNVAIFLLTAFSFHCQGADKYTLEYNLEKGKTYTQRMVMDMNMSMNAMGQDIKVNTNTEMVVNFDVLNKNNDVYDVQVTYKKIKINVTGPAIYSIDSDSTETSSDKNSAGVIKSLVGIPIDVQLTKQGKVVSVSGVDKLTEKIHNVANPQFEQMFSAQFSEKAIQKLIEQSSFFPEKPVAIGDTWEITSTINTTGFDIINKMNLTLKQVKDNVATIDFTSTIATPEGGEVTKIQGMDAKISMDGTQAGTVQINMKTGWIIQSQIDMKSTQNIEVMGQTMLQEIGAKTTITGN